MKTKYILHGGGALDKNEMNDEFFREILSLDKKDLRILIIPFALDEKIFKIDFVASQFEKNNIDKNLNFDSAEIGKLEEQIKNADIIYLIGGKTLKLLAVLADFKNLSDLFNGKVVVGESAGAYVLSSCFYSKSIDICSEGLKLVPVKTICHYDGEDKERLANCSKELEELILKDYEFKMFTV
ncbi:MAG: Type 1 glutamine amidotransferase-like domain-containing protein [Patescibacteria group bacterium]|jgi:peptidase E|nr:Type 1 glutamine amidotransferase-like domain-containing protein [Patescibacteria group bacterium]